MGKQSSWMGVTVFRRKPVLNLDFLRFPGENIDAVQCSVLSVVSCASSYACLHN